ALVRKRDSRRPGAASRHAAAALAVTIAAARAPERVVVRMDIVRLSALADPGDRVADVDRDIRRVEPDGGPADAHAMVGGLCADGGQGKHRDSHYLNERVHIVLLRW